MKVLLGLLVFVALSMVCMDIYTASAEAHASEVSFLTLNEVTVLLLSGAIGGVGWYIALMSQDMRKLSAAQSKIDRRLARIEGKIGVQVHDDEG